MSKSLTAKQKRPRFQKRVRPMLSLQGPTRVVQSDWSLISGRLPFMNDPTEDNRIYEFTLNVTQDAVLNTSTTVPTFIGGVLGIGGFPGAASKLAVFDQYRIVEAQLWIVPQKSDTTAMWHSVIDYDNATNPTSLNQLQSYSNCHSTTFGLGHYHKWQPHVAVAAYRTGGVFTGFANEASPWLDSAYTDIQHYGYKIACEATPSGVISINTVLRIRVQFRNPFN